jgi:hypothetical protein
MYPVCTLELPNKALQRTPLLRIGAVELER